MNEQTSPFIGFSYDRHKTLGLVERLSALLTQEGVPVWYLRSVVSSGTPSGDDWKALEANWHGLFLDGMRKAQGVIVLRSEQFECPKEGSGMWRENRFLAHLSQNGPIRVKRLSVPLSLQDDMQPQPPEKPPLVSPSPEGVERVGYERAFDRANRSADESFAEEARRFETAQQKFGHDRELWCRDIALQTVSWAKEVLVLPSIGYASTADEKQNILINGQPSSLFEWGRRFSIGRETWYTLIAVDLYDVQWFCQRCGLRSEPYLYHEQQPPASCPQCGCQITARNEGS